MAQQRGTYIRTYIETNKQIIETLLKLILQQERRSLKALSPADVEFNFLFCLFSICRPLPSEMVRYAREDTHYLLYICDRLQNELIIKGNANSNLLQSVYSRSKDVCLKVCWTWITCICR